MRTLEEALDGAASDYGRFCRAALDLEWISLPERHEEWRQKYPTGVFLDFYDFPRGYLKDHFPEAYARMILARMAVWEEWPADFWCIPREERQRYLDQGRELYEGYAIVREQRMIDRDWEYLKGEIAAFSEGGAASRVWREACFADFAPARVLELGGSWSGDWVYLAVDRSRVLLADCGIWD